MSNENYEKILEISKYCINEFEACGLGEEVRKRILELVQEWEKRKSEADKEGKQIGGLTVIFWDLERAVNKAKADSKKSGKSVCEYFERSLSIPYDQKGGLGYWSTRFWQN
jgi:hypothetical protein